MSTRDESPYNQPLKFEQWAKRLFRCFVLKNVLKKIKNTKDYLAFYLVDKLLSKKWHYMFLILGGLSYESKLHMFHEQMDKMFSCAEWQPPWISTKFAWMLTSCSRHIGALQLAEVAVHWCSSKSDVLMDTQREKKHPQIKLQRFREVRIWTFGWLVHQINSWYEVLKDTLKSFDDLKNKQESVWSNVFWFVKIYIFWNCI